MASPPKSKAGVTTTDKEKAVLQSAPAPLHTHIILGCFLAVFVYTFPSLESIDEVATVEILTRRVFPELLSLEGLVLVRLFFAAIPYTTIVYGMLYSE